VSPVTDEMVDAAKDAFARNTSVASCMASEPWRAAIEAAVAPDTLRVQLQQKCTDWGAYWRASDAHGVDLTRDQALELLRDALGVEVEITREVLR
jgi:hypothetical protein